MRTDTRPINSQHWRYTVRPFVAHRASLRCEHCFQFLGLCGQVDHIVPRSEIGMLGISVFDPSNLQYLCISCHSAKSNRERAAGREKKPPKGHNRSHVPGRDKFLDAIGLTPAPERN
ncbi:hypothetical protein GCM10010873_30680 [Cypionkella aquatica]|uniref:HNH domain-containing protein n=1 Tax=Cypionkella aquatica TaxID=1756042 RepID=A0AA37TVJ0_9RHOB|nr:HNH endonuclease [Cypionkella aquatica]GLS88094.1 hypothetical protein GCM10010873_30680 [Cypionkella aquatica]